MRSKIRPSRLKTHDLRTCIDECYQAFLLLGGQLRSATATMAVDYTLHAAHQKGPLPVIETGRAEVPALTQHRHGHLVHQQVDQHGDPPYQTHIITLIGVLKPAMQVFDGGATELYPDAHGCILLLHYSDLVL